MVPRVVPPSARRRGKSGHRRGHGQGGTTKVTARGRQALASNAIALRELQDRLKTLSSDFYSLIPHFFGRSPPPTLASNEAVKEKLDLLEVLWNVGISHELESSEADRAKDPKRFVRVTHPLDARYNAIGAIMEPLNESDEEFKAIQR